MTKNRIDIVMDLLGLTAKKVSNDIGVSTTMVYRYQRGLNEPSYEVLTKLCMTYFGN